ncbi:MAG: class I SAM-dependent RNA methyltransferase [Clostridia bacterium]|nr:class I SAM-dependent RNA methyltransferase [Clostridia bacterium]
MYKYNYVATCLFGLEKFVSDEIAALGYEKTEVMDGRIYFSADISAVAGFNINSRYAERLFIDLGSFKALSFDDLFEGVKALPLENWIGRNDAFPVKGHSIRSKLFSIPDCQKIIKKAAAERLTAVYGASLPEVGIKYQIEFFIFKDRVTIMIDTSGAPLHKRGYRTEANDAPLRETLAAALVNISRPRENVITWDPFCGSGTIAIEAALMMSDRAPGLYRTFSAEQFPAVPESVWQNAREEAKSRIVNNGFIAFASDIDPMCIKTAEANARRAGVSDMLKIFGMNALDIKKDDKRVTIVCNPPYGERLSTVKECEKLYREMGTVFSELSPWQIYILTSHPDFQKIYGKRADKVRVLYNGMIKCGFYQYFRNNKVK